MATGKKTASKAASELKSSKPTATDKSVAGSDLVQAKGKGSKKKSNKLWSGNVLQWIRTANGHAISLG